MKVLMFGWEFPPNISGGLGTACYGLARGLSANNIDLNFIVPRVYGDEVTGKIKLISASDIDIPYVHRVSRDVEKSKKNVEFDQSVTAYTTPEQYERILIEKEKISGRKPDSHKLRHKFEGHYGSRLFDEVEWYGSACSEIARMVPHDIIHAHDWLTYPAGIKAKEISGKPLVVHVHATEFDRCGENINNQVFQIEKLGMLSADKVITVSNYTRKIIIDRYNIAPYKVVTVYNAVDVPDKTLCDPGLKNICNDHIVTFLGRVTWQKGPEYFITAAHKVLQKMKNTRFIMAGTGDLLGAMIKYTARMKIADRIHFTGFLKGIDVRRLLSMSDLYVMPSVSEPFGIAPLEAIQNNIPVIISKQSGVSEILTHAIKVDYWDIEAIANAIYGVLNYLPLAKYLKDNSKKELKHITWINAAASVKEIYHHAIQQAG